MFQVSASDKDSSDHHYNAVFFKIAGGDKVSEKKIIHTVVISRILMTPVESYILTYHIYFNFSRFYRLFISKTKFYYQSTLFILLSSFLLELTPVHSVCN